MYDGYDSGQHHPDEQHMMNYHTMESVHQDLSPYQEPVYPNYPQPSGHDQAQACQQNYTEHQQQYYPLQHHQHHQHQQQQQQQPSSDYHPHLQQHPSPSEYHLYQEHQQRPVSDFHLHHHHHLQQSPASEFVPQHQHQPSPSAMHYQHYQQQAAASHVHPQHQEATHLGELSIRLKTEPPDFPQTTTPTSVKKKRGRPAKQQAENGEAPGEDDEVEAAKKAKRILNRFNGMSVEEVMARTLPDVITHNLDILIIGINPGLLSAFKGHHYPNPGNHFWKCLFLSGLTEQQLSYMHDQSLPDMYRIGFTNMVERTTPGSKDLSSKEIREGGRQLLEKLQKYKPLIAAFNGKGIYEIFCKEIFGVKAKNLEFGLQPYKIPETKTVCYLMPSSSPRCAQFPRAQDKVHFYIKLKELRDQMKGLAPGSEVFETQYSFDLQLAKEDAKRLLIKEERMDPEYESCSGQQEEVW